MDGVKKWRRIHARILPVTALGFLLTSLQTTFHLRNSGFNNKKWITEQICVQNCLFPSLFWKLLRREDWSPSIESTYWGRPNAGSSVPLRSLGSKRHWREKHWKKNMTLATTLNQMRRVSSVPQKDRNSSSIQCTNSFFLDQCSENVPNSAWVRSLGSCNNDTGSVNLGSLKESKWCVDLFEVDSSEHLVGWLWSSYKFQPFLPQTWFSLGWFYPSRRNRKPILAVATRTT